MALHKGKKSNKKIVFVCAHSLSESRANFQYYSRSKLEGIFQSHKTRTFVFRQNPLL